LASLEEIDEMKQMYSSIRIVVDTWANENSLIKLHEFNKMLEGDLKFCKNSEEKQKTMLKAFDEYASHHLLIHMVNLLEKNPILTKQVQKREYERIEKALLTAIKNLPSDWDAYDFLLEQIAKPALGSGKVKFACAFKAQDLASDIFRFDQAGLQLKVLNSPEFPLVAEMGLKMIESALKLEEPASRLRELERIAIGANDEKIADLAARNFIYTCKNEAEFEALLKQHKDGRFPQKHLKAIADSLDEVGLDYAKKVLKKRDGDFYTAEAAVLPTGVFDFSPKAKEFFAPTPDRVNIATAKGEYSYLMRVAGDEGLAKELRDAAYEKILPAVEKFIADMEKNGEDGKDAICTLALIESQHGVEFPPEARQLIESKVGAIEVQRGSTTYMDIINASKNAKKKSNAATTGQDGKAQPGTNIQKGKV